MGPPVKPVSRLIRPLGQKQTPDNVLTILRLIGSTAYWAKIFSNGLGPIRLLQLNYLFVITRSLVKARGQAGIIIIHFIVVSLAHRRIQTVQPLEAAMYDKIRVWLSFPRDTDSKSSRGSNTLLTPSHTTVAVR